MQGHIVRNHGNRIFMLPGGFCELCYSRCLWRAGILLVRGVTAAKLARAALQKHNSEEHQLLGFISNQSFYFRQQLFPQCPSPAAQWLAHVTSPWLKSCVLFGAGLWNKSLTLPRVPQRWFLLFFFPTRFVLLRAKAKHRQPGPSGDQYYELPILYLLGLQSS